MAVLIQQLGGAADISLMQSGMTHYTIFTDKTLLSAIFVTQEVLNAFAASLFLNFSPAQMNQGEII